MFSYFLVISLETKATNRTSSNHIYIYIYIRSFICSRCKIIDLHILYIYDYICVCMYILHHAIYTHTDTISTYSRSLKKHGDRTCVFNPVQSFLGKLCPAALDILSNQWSFFCGPGDEALQSLQCSKTMSSLSVENGIPRMYWENPTFIGEYSPRTNQPTIILSFIPWSPHSLMTSQSPISMTI